jgi:phosphoribosyl 1,2-cyclic phosphodiesterase
MSARFSVLASGSSGNASLLEVDGFGVLIDVGLSPRRIASRLAAIGADWSNVNAVLLTHTHGDHWNSRTVGYLRRHAIRLYCHESHVEQLAVYCKEFPRLRSDSLVRNYAEDHAWELAPNLRVRPIRVCHDSSATFGFRFDGANWSVACVSDLGCWDLDLARMVADVDVLCLEFNHDVEMEYASGRSAELIARVLGPDGHLSNEQAAALFRKVLELSAPGRLRHLVQLHLSRECNTPDLAAGSVHAVLRGPAPSVQVHTACQDQAGPVIRLDFSTRPQRVIAKPVLQRMLPGWDD